MPSGPGFGLIVRTLKQRNFRIYVSGNAVSLIGNWVQRTAVGWLTWELTQSGFWLGVVACADLLPVVVVGPFGGVLADRLDCRRLIMMAQSAALCQAVLLFALAAFGVLTVELLVLLVLVNGVIIGIYQPARLAFIFSLLPREDLSTGIAINSVVFNLARFIGPAVAGLLILSLGVAGAFAANALSFLFFLVALAVLRIAEKPAKSSSVERASLLSQLGDGLRYTLRHPGIAPLLLLLLAASFGLRPFVELLPGFAARVFAGGVDTLALLSSSIGIGAVVSGILMARRGGGGLTRLVLVAALLLAVSVLAFAATETLWFATISVVCAGMCMVASGVGMQTLMQMSVDGAMRGRVLSLYGIVFAAGPAAGALVMGGLSESLGLRLPLLAGAVLMLMVWVWTWRRRATISAALEPDSPMLS